MKISDNYSSSYNKKTKQFIVVESFDNYEFDVRLGTISSTEFIGTIIATTDAELNKKIKDLIKKNT